MPALPPEDRAPERAGPGVRPKSVDTAVMLWVAGAVISIVAGIVVLVFGGDQFAEAARRSLQTAGTPFTEDDVRSRIAAAKLLSAVISFAFFALTMLFVLMMRAGRNWARVVLTVLGALSIVSLLLSFSQAGGLDLTLGLVQAVLAGAAIYFMFQPDARPYFAPRRP